MPVDLVREDEYGSYLGASPEFSRWFDQVEADPNFDVFDRGPVRLVVAKCSRVADDEAPEQGRYGIDFHRAKPVFDGPSEFTYYREGRPFPVNARSYAAELPDSLKDTAFTGNIAFAARTADEYGRKAGVYDRFYDYVFGAEPRTVYVVPHTGRVSREPDEVQPDPKFNIDSWAAGVAVLCALRDPGGPGRYMVSIHANGYLGAVVDVGDFGLLDPAQLQRAVSRVCRKYRPRIHSLSTRLKEELFKRSMGKIRDVWAIRGTLHPERLGQISPLDRFEVEKLAKCLRHYGGRIEHYTLREFEEALSHFLQGAELKAVAINRVFSGRKTSRLLGLPQKVKWGLLNAAVQIECSKIYLEKEPELMAQIILDLRRELWGA